MKTPKARDDPGWPSRSHSSPVVHTRLLNINSPRQPQAAMCSASAVQWRIDASEEEDRYIKNARK